MNQLVSDKIKHLNSSAAINQTLINIIPKTATPSATDQTDNNSAVHHLRASQNGSMNSNSDDSDNMNTFQAPLHNYSLSNNALHHTTNNSSSVTEHPKSSYNREFYLLSKKLRKFLPFNHGLKNHGNTCFMNCVLQCLFHTSPLCEYFVTNQHDDDINRIRIQQESAAAVPARFVLTRHFHRLLLSMWQNTYESIYSVQIKGLIGDLNPTFAGVNQNDSHEFCVWFLDRLSQELSFKINVTRSIVAATDRSDYGDNATVPGMNQPAKTRVEVATTSFIEDLFKVEFKSSVICSKCKYKSTKNETDMMLSLPLPQMNANTRQQQQRVTSQRPLPPKKYQRKSLYANLILSNSASIRYFLNSTQLISVNSSNQLNMPEYSYSTMNTNTTTPSISTAIQTPVNVRIAFNVHITSEDAYYAKELVKLNETSTNNTVINPDFNDLRHYLGSTYQLDESLLVFVDMQATHSDLNDAWSVKEKIIRSCSPFYVVELNQIAPPSSEQQQQQVPMINIVAFNVYSEVRQHDRVMLNFGLPFAVLINRDCTYAELCKKLLESQAKYFKDKNILKYKVKIEASLKDKIFLVISKKSDTFFGFRKLIQKETIVFFTVELSKKLKKGRKIKRKIYLALFFLG